MRYYFEYARNCLRCRNYPTLPYTFYTFIAGTDSFWGGPRNPLNKPHGMPVLQNDSGYTKVPFFVLSRLLEISSLLVSRTGSASDWCALREALYKSIDTCTI